MRHLLASVLGMSSSAVVTGSGDSNGASKPLSMEQVILLAHLQRDCGIALGAWIEELRWMPLAGAAPPLLGKFAATESQR